MELYRERDQFPSRYNFDEDLEYFYIPEKEGLWFFKSKGMRPIKPYSQSTKDTVIDKKVVGAIADLPDPESEEE